MNQIQAGLYRQQVTIFDNMKRQKSCDALNSRAAVVHAI